MKFRKHKRLVACLLDAVAFKEHFLSQVSKTYLTVTPNIRKQAH